MVAAGRIRGLDGLRALGCALVLVYHLWPAWAPGGNIGVDVFLVVSGFLITTLLLREIARRGTVDLRDFLARRTRRLVPAVVVCALVVASLAAIVGGDVLVGIGRQLLGTLTFTANWVQVATGQSYFDQQTPALLTHTWSLGIEQQFYLLWPLLLLATWAAPRAVRPWIALGIGAGSLALAAWLGGNRAYLGTDTHLYGLMLGAALAFVLVPAPRRGARPVPGDLVRLTTGRATLRALVAGASLAGLLLLAVLSSAHDPRAIPWYLLAASVLTAGVIQAMTPAVLEHAAGRAVVYVLDLRPVVWLGERSYSVYLWHWPLLVLARARWPYADQRLLALGVLLATVLAAEASYRWVETPVRTLGVAGSFRALRERSLRLGLPVGLAGALVVGATTWAVATAPPRTSVEEMLLAAHSSAVPAPTGVDHTSSPEDPAGEDPAGPGGGDGATPDGDRAGTAPSDGGHGAGGSFGAGHGPGAAGQAPPAGPGQAFGPGGAHGQGGLYGQGGPHGSGGPHGPGETDVPEEPGGPGRSEETDVPREPAAPDEPAGGTAVTGDRVSAVGDSVTLAASAALHEALPGLTVDGEVSRSFGAVVTIVRGMAATGELRPYVVVGGATNGVVHAEQVDELAAAVGPERCVVLVTAHGSPSATWIPGANEQLRAGAGRHPNMVLADWHAVAAADPQILAADLVHPGAEGGRRYAQTITDALRRCP